MSEPRGLSAPKSAEPEARPLPDSLLGARARWPARIVRYRWPIVVFWGALFLALGPSAREVERRLEAAAQLPSGQAHEVRLELQRRFRSPFTDRVLLVVDGVPQPGSLEGREVLEQIVRTLRETSGVAAVLSSLDSREPAFLGRDGGYLVIVGLDAGAGTLEDRLPHLREVTSALAGRLYPSYPRVWFGWTGEAPLNFDLRRASARDVRAAEMRVLPLTLALLLMVFGSLVASVLPLGVGVLSITLCLGIAAWLTRLASLSILIQSVSSMIGLGLAIDYALLTVSRFRESLAAGQGTRVATEEAARRAGWTIFLSAFPVSVSFAALLTIPLSELRSVGLGGLLVTLLSVALSVTLLPAVLSLLGPRIDMLRILRTPSRRAGASSEAWRRWGQRVTARPGFALALASAPLLLLASQARRVDISMPLGDWLPQGSESVDAYHRLERMGRANVVHTLRVLLDFPAGITLDNEGGWLAARRLLERLSADPRIETVQCLPAVMNRPDGFRFLPLVPPGIRRSLEAADGSAALFEAIPASRMTPREEEGLARELRRWDAREATGLAGATLRVGGLPAFNADYENTIARFFRGAVALVVGGTLFGLFAGFRSLLVAIKAVLLNLLSVSASFGALVLVFQEGHGARWIGIPGPTGSVFPIIPILVFCIVFGLSMDYEVILVARIAEARRQGLGERAAICEGLARTGTLITSAALIMIAVFAGFALGSFLPIKMLGFALSVAVLIDATAVRMVIGPALLRLAGRWNWWPGGLRSNVRAPGSPTDD